MRYKPSASATAKAGGSISVFGGVAPLVIYNNTIIMSPTGWRDGNVSMAKVVH